MLTLWRANDNTINTRNTALQVGEGRLTVFFFSIFFAKMIAFLVTMLLVACEAHNWVWIDQKINYGFFFLQQKNVFTNT